MKVTTLRCMNRENPLGIGRSPYFSWMLESNKENTRQVFYQLVVKDEAQAVIWDTGVQESDRSCYILYSGKALKSAVKYIWEVTVQNNHGEEATASGWFETGLLNKEDWRAKWIVSSLSSKPGKNGGGPALLFRKQFSLKRKITKARIYATCHGIYRLSVNGNRADDRELAPEYTVYEKYLCVQTYDITALLEENENVVGMTVGDGWYRGFTTKQKHSGYDHRHACLWQIEVTYEDGSRERIVSDETLKAAKSAVLKSDLFNGETYDANLEKKGWDTSGYMAADWDNVQIAGFGYDNLVPQDGEPVKAVMTLSVKEVINTPKGEKVLDIGQNIAGRLRMKLNLPRGTVVTFEHSEALDQNGNYFNNIQGINQKDSFTSSGEEMIFEPMYTFHGFRYVRVTGIDTINTDDFEAVVLATDEEWIGSFSCSDNKINRLVENTRWSQRTNMLSIPTDCPQREKMGWTGDMAVYTKTALMNQDLTGLFTRWLENLSLSQLSDGQIPNVVPWADFYRAVSKLTNILLGGSFKDVASSGWGDAAVIVPWALYEATGNINVLKKQYTSMKAWVDYMRKQAETKRPKKKAQDPETEKYLWNTGFHFGEWLIPSATDQGSMSAAVKKSAKQGRHYIAPVFYYMSCKILGKTAAILGKNEDAKTYGELSKRIKAAYQKSMLLADGTLKIDVQGAYALALGAGLIPEEQQKGTSNRLAHLIHENDDRLDVGFLAIPFLLDALSDNGHLALAYTLLRQNKRPSWMFEVEAGATTIWENWNCVDDQGRVKVISMNHYAFGCVADWIYRKIGGIVGEKAGYHRFIIKPQPDHKLNWAKHTYLSSYGLITCEWKRDKNTFYLKTQIPCNTQATIIMPDGGSYQRGSGTYEFSCTEP